MNALTRPRLAWAFLGLMAMVGCQGDDAPTFPDAGLIFPDAATVDASDTQTGCEAVEDCPVAMDCCLTVACVARQCSYTVLTNCCSVLGSCAAASPFHSGMCTTTCEAYGCESLLRLPETGCGETLFTLTPSAEVPVATVDRRGQGTRLDWYRDLRAPYGLEPSWRLADAHCDVLHNGALSAECVPLGGVTEAFYAELTFPPVSLPSGSGLILEAHIDGEAFLGAGTSGAPQITFEAVFPNGAVATLWRSADAAAEDPPLAGTRWRAVAADLSAYGGQEVVVRVTVSASAGQHRHDPGFGLGTLTIRAPCAGERQNTGPVACETTQAITIQRSNDTLYTTVLATPGSSCLTCETAVDCPETPGCIARTCEAGYCKIADDASQCCGTAEPSPALWLTSLAGWTLSGTPWLETVAPDTAAEIAFHFPLAGQAGVPQGAMTTAAFFVPPGDAVLSFDLWLETEWDDAATTTSSAEIDVLRVELGTLTPSPPLELWHSGLIGGSTRGRWQRVTIPIAAAAGSLATLTFHFDAGDPDFNEYGGVWIRRLALGAGCVSSSL